MALFLQFDAVCVPKPLSSTNYRASKNKQNTHTKCIADTCSVNQFSLSIYTFCSRAHKQINVRGTRAHTHDEHRDGGWKNGWTNRLLCHKSNCLSGGKVVASYGTTENYVKMNLKMHGCTRSHTCNGNDYCMKIIAVFSLCILFYSHPHRTLRRTFCNS